MLKQLKKMLPALLVTSIIINSQFVMGEKFEGVIDSKILQEFDGGTICKERYYENGESKVKIVTHYDDGTSADYLISNDKIKKNLKDKINSSTVNEKFTVSIWTSDIDNRLIENSVKTTLGITDVKKIKAKKLQEFIEAKRSKAKEVYNLKNKDLKVKLKKINIDDSDIIFTSQYSPLIIAKVNKKAIQELEAFSDVSALDLFQDAKQIDETQFSLPNINATIPRNTMGLNGQGVKIGVLEVGYPDRLNSQLANAYTNNRLIFDINDLSVISDRVTSHATMVTSIIAGSTDGIVPNATIYAAFAQTRLQDYTKIEWLINQGVSIINFSAGCIDIRGEYSDMAKWLDHIAVQHDVVFVKSAGNRAGTKRTITDPGMAYNAVVVGSTNDHNSTNEPNWTDDTFSTYSCYEETSGGSKPDITAPGEDICAAGFTNSGTSFSSPHVTGVLAQAIQFGGGQLYPRNTNLKALIAACVTHKTADDYPVAGDNSYTPFYSNKEGAGVIDSLSIISSLANQYYRNLTKTNTQFPFVENVNFTSSSAPVRISLAWQKNNTVDDSTNTVINRNLSDLDMYVYDPNGNIVSYSLSSNNNVELVEFTPTMTGSYTIFIDGYEIVNSSENLTLAWKK